MREAWILAGVLDGSVGHPRLGDDICGIPHGLRLACDLAHAGARRIYVVWNGKGPAPDLARIGSDPRLAALASLEVVTAPPHLVEAADDDPILVVRADRLFHRDMPKLVAGAYRIARDRAGHDRPGDPARYLAKIAGAEHDAVFVTDRATATRLADCAYYAAGLAREVAATTSPDGHALIEVDPPYAGFTARASSPGSLRRAEKQLVSSLRKAADGIAAKAVNRRISLPISRVLARTKITPNHVTVFALLLALAGGGIIATGGYTAGVVGMLLVELGSIIDGVDGELARLRFQFSRFGQWLDTTVDDVANVAYVSGVIVNLHLAGVTWAMPVGAAALACFAITQGAQYTLIKWVYKSGDLAAIPWAFQSSEFLSRRPTVRTVLPKLLKRDFVVTVFFALALLGRLDLVLLGFAAGAFAFFVVFFVQLARNRRSVTS